MRKITAVPYYAFSILTLLVKLNFWVIPLLLLKTPVLLKLQNGFLFYVANFMDVWAVKEIVLDKQYEVFSKVDKKDVVIDMGGGIGDFSISISTRVKKVFSFEMDKKRHEIMRKNIAINNCKNITAICKKVRSLDYIFRQMKVEKCDLLKIDCEGCEYEIFKNCSKGTFKKIKQIIMEVHLFNNKMNHAYKKLKKTLRANNFKLREKENPVHDYLMFLYGYKSTTKIS